MWLYYIFLKILLYVWLEVLGKKDRKSPEPAREGVILFFFADLQRYEGLTPALWASSGWGPAPRRPQTQYRQLDEDSPLGLPGLIHLPLWVRRVKLLFSTFFSPWQIWDDTLIRSIGSQWQWVSAEGPYPTPPTLCLPPGPRVSSSRYVCWDLCWK